MPFLYLLTQRLTNKYCASEVVCLQSYLIWGFLEVPPKLKNTQ